MAGATNFDVRSWAHRRRFVEPGVGARVEPVK
jgi:hypothetical protein